MSAVLGAAAAAGGRILVSEILNYAFTAADAGLERKAIIDEALALEANGATPEQTLTALQDKRRADHAALGDALKP